MLFLPLNVLPSQRGFSDEFNKPQIRPHHSCWSAPAPACSCPPSHPFCVHSPCPFAGSLGLTIIRLPPLGTLRLPPKFPVYPFPPFFPAEGCGLLWAAAVKLYSSGFLLGCPVGDNRQEVRERERSAAGVFSPLILPHRGVGWKSLCFAPEVQPLLQQ